MKINLSWKIFRTAVFITNGYMIREKNLWTMQRLSETKSWMLSNLVHYLSNLMSLKRTFLAGLRITYGVLTEPSKVYCEQLSRN